MDQHIQHAFSRIGMVWCPHHAEDHRPSSVPLNFTTVRVSAMRVFFVGRISRTPYVVLFVAPHLLKREVRKSLLS